MPEEVVIDTPVIVEATNPFAQDAWKTEVAAAPVVTEPVIEKKEEVIIAEVVIPAKTEVVITEKPKEEAKPEPIKFANETSEKIYNAIRDGKIDEIEKHFEEKNRLTKADGADAIKLQLQYENKEFTPDEITDLFNEKYNIPEKPIQDTINETDDEFEVRETKYKDDLAKHERKITRDAKIAKVELNKITQELVLPEIPKTPEAIAEPTQEELDAQKKALDEFLQSAEKEIKNFNGYETTFKDEEVQLSVAYKPTEEEMKVIEPLLAAAYTDAPEFLKQLGWFADGKFNTAKLTADLHILLNKDKVINDLVSEAANQRYAEVKRTHKNIDFSGQKRSGNLNPTPAEEGKKMVTHFFQN